MGTVQTAPIETAAPNLRQVWMTPEWAQQLLDDRPLNRTIRRALVEALAADMASGKFDSSVIAPIRINRRGQLTDGQHRLSAIAMYGKPVLLWIETTDSDRFDLGRSRTASDLLSFSGVDNARTAAAVMRIILQCDRMRAARRPWLRGSESSRNISAATISIEYSQRPHLVDLVVRSVALYQQQPKFARVITATCAAALMHYSVQDLGDSTHAELLLADIVGGHGESGSPAFAYRRFAGNLSAQDRSQIEFPTLMHCLRLAYHDRRCMLIRMSSFGDVSDLKNAPKGA
jgi:hypothetical protein